MSIGKRDLVLCLIVGLLVASILGCVGRNGSNKLTYRAPLEMNLSPGEFIPGTPIQYIGASDNGAVVMISGQQAIKQRADSLDWKGDPLPDVHMEWALRTVGYDTNSLRVAGTVKIEIRNPAVQPSGIHTTSPLKFDAPVTYNVNKGALIPGSLIQYAGKTDQGAQLAGVSGYPYRKTGDSILWEGQIKPDVYLKLNVRALLITDRSMQVGGVATIWVGR